eukprot:364885-Chlamydomonas_euryale.AAC.3
MNHARPLQPQPGSLPACPSCPHFLPTFPAQPPSSPAHFAPSLGHKAPSVFLPARRQQYLIKACFWRPSDLDTPGRRSPASGPRRDEQLVTVAQHARKTGAHKTHTHEGRGRGGWDGPGPGGCWKWRSTLIRLREAR